MRVFPVRASLKSSLRSSWVVLGSAGLSIGLLAFLLVSYLDYRQLLAQTEDDLMVKSSAIDRRISAEVLGGRKEVTDNVIRDLVKWYGLDSIVTKSGAFPCAESSFCIKTESNQLSVYRKSSESLDGQGYLQISAQVPSFLRSLKWVYFIVVFLPAFGFFLIGIYLQKRTLNRLLIDPINRLVSKSYTGEEVPSDWPEEIAELSEKLDRAFRERDHAMIGQLAGGVMHDIKTYLHSVSVATDLATEKVGTEKFLLRLEGLYRACFQQVPKMKAIVESVLDGSRDVRVQLQEVDLVKVIHSAVESCQELALHSGVQIEVVSQSSFGAWIDPTQIERAISNVLKNGIEASQEKLLLERSKERLNGLVRISLVDAEMHVECVVEDSGPGMKGSSQRVFENVRTTKTHGTGLGLMITKKIVEAHRGRINATQSSSLGGAKVTIQLPMNNGRAV